MCVRERGRLVGPTVGLPLELLLGLMGDGPVWTHHSHQPLLQVGWRTETAKRENSQSENLYGYTKRQGQQ